MSDELKAQVGKAALEHVRDGMKLGIGSGSTAEAFIRALGEAVENGLNVIGVPTSIRTADLCKSLKIPLTTLEETPHLDLAIDGADEIDPHLNLIKGGGGALLREKIVAAAADDMLVIADDSKLVNILGAFDLPIEVNRFGLASTISKIEQAAANCSVSGALKVREGSDGQPFVTDGGHLIVDASFGRIADPEVLASALVSVPGVVEHGLFTGLASSAIVAASDGIRIVTAK